MGIEPSAPPAASRSLPPPAWCFQARLQHEWSNKVERSRAQSAAHWRVVQPNACYIRGSQSESEPGLKERTHKVYSRVERGKTEGIKQRAGRCHEGHAIAHSPEPPHTNPTRPTGTCEQGAEPLKPCPTKWSVACRQRHPVPPAPQQTAAA
eukprot:351631-Chlamydomonas_euryale.AAC.6